ncbi:helix-turn-helix domain-containing protein [Parasalinivibrio latis]|uniref:DUF6597 domain-containing transcriptional factor n=1 Tax=Parasalinivibrio latis TaxID=2952610 RepID=UPI0030DFB484
MDYRPVQGDVGEGGIYQVYYPEPAMRHVVECFWQLTVTAGSYSYRSIPDNCVDWVTEIGTPDISLLVPPFKAPAFFALYGPAIYFGIRFQPLGQHCLTGTPVGEWGCSTEGISAYDLLPAPLAYHINETLVAVNTFEQRCTALSSLLSREISDPLADRRFHQFVRQTLTLPSTDNHHDLAAASGISERQLRRLSHLYTGLSPKSLQRIFRFQQTLARMHRCNDPAAWSTYYYDQSHFIREFRAFTGMTPLAFRRKSVLYNKDEHC